MATKSKPKKKLTKTQVKRKLKQASKIMYDLVNVLGSIEKVKLNFGIDVNYFNIDYKDKNSVENKILELSKLSVKQLFTEYNKTFEKAKQNQKLIKQYLNKYYEKIG